MAKPTFAFNWKIRYQQTFTEAPEATCLQNYGPYARFKNNHVEDSDEFVLPNVTTQIQMMKSMTAAGGVYIDKEVKKYSKEQISFIKKVVRFRLFLVNRVKHLLKNNKLQNYVIDKDKIFFYLHKDAKDQLEQPAQYKGMKIEDYISMIAEAVPMYITNDFTLYMCIKAADGDILKSTDKRYIQYLNDWIKYEKSI
jgi:hypothetical protein